MRNVAIHALAMMLEYAMNAVWLLHLAFNAITTPMLVFALMALGFPVGTDCKR